MSIPTKPSPTPAGRVSTSAVLVALALLFSYVELLLPLSPGIPGMKLGLANIVIIVALYTLGNRTALLVNIARIALTAALYGNVFSALYAFAGGFLSFIAMALLKNTDRFSIAGVSMSGGAAHNLAQLFLASLLVEQALLLSYAPLLLLAGMATGILNGMLATWILRALGQRANDQ